VLGFTPTLGQSRVATFGNEVSFKVFTFENVKIWEFYTCCIDA
jgi:hypothetical protein